MKNGFNIEWTFEAEQNLNAIFDYLEAVWTEREISSFAKKLETNLQIISKHPAMFPFYNRTHLNFFLFSNFLRRITIKAI